MITVLRLRLIAIQDLQEARAPDKGVFRYLFFCFRTFSIKHVLNFYGNIRKHLLCIPWSRAEYFTKSGNYMKFSYPDQNAHVQTDHSISVKRMSCWYLTACRNSYFTALSSCFLFSVFSRITRLQICFFLGTRSSYMYQYVYCLAKPKTTLCFSFHE